MEALVQLVALGASMVGRKKEIVRHLCKKIGVIVDRNW